MILRVSRTSNLAKVKCQDVNVGFTTFTTKVGQGPSVFNFQTVEDNGYQRDTLGRFKVYKKCWMSVCIGHHPVKMLSNIENRVKFMLLLLSIRKKILNVFIFCLYCLASRFPAFFSLEINIFSFSHLITKEYFC